MASGDATVNLGLALHGQPSLWTIPCHRVRGWNQEAGVFTEGSIALTSPEPHGLFLASEWEIDEAGNVMSEVPGTAGVTLLGTRGIRSIRILEPGEEDGENGEQGS